MTDYADKVKRGIKLLDNEKPGWRDLVKVDSLDLGSCAVCVLGQVFGDYSTGLEELGLSGGNAYGFDGPSGQMEDLTRAWKEALGEENVLIETGDVYRDTYGYAVKVIQTHFLDLGGEQTSVYIVQGGSVTNNVFKVTRDGQDLAVLYRKNFGKNGSYHTKVEKFAVKAGMFLVNDAGQKFYALSADEVRPLEDAAFAKWIKNVDQKGLREMKLPGGAPFSATLVK